MNNFFNYYYKINMIGGNELTNKYDDITKMYSNIPESGLFDMIESETATNKAIVKFKKFCNFILDITNDEKIYKLLQKKFITNMKINKTKEMKSILVLLKLKRYHNIDMIEKNIDSIKENDIRKTLHKQFKSILEKYDYYKIHEELSNETKKMGKYSMKIGHDFELKVSKSILPIISKQLNYNIDDLILVENSLLKIKKENEIILIGEIDVIVLDKKTNSIIAVGEIKKSLDDISDALFQINRTFDNIKNKDVFLELNGTIYPKNIFNNIKMMDSTELLSRSFIFTEYNISKKYKKTPSKLSLVLLQILWSGNINNISNKFYKKLFFRIKKKQKNRYITDVVNTIELFKKNNLLDRIILI